MKILPIYDIFKLTQTWNYNVSLCRDRPKKSFLRIWLDGIIVFLLNDLNRDTVKQPLPRYDYAWNRVKSNTDINVA